MVATWLPSGFQSKLVAASLLGMHKIRSENDSDHCLVAVVFVAPASGMAGYRDPVFRLFVHPYVNICDHPSVDPSVQVRNSETL